MKKSFNISFELKIFLFIIFILIIGLSMLNIIFIYSFKGEIRSNLLKEIEFHNKLSAHTESTKIPEYIKVSDKDKIIKGFRLFDVLNSTRYYVRDNYFKGKIKDKLFLLFYWDAVIVLTVSVLYYFTAYRILKNKENYSKLFEIVLLVFAHKIKNYLAAQRINIDIISSNRDSGNAVKRLKKGNLNFSDELESIFSFIKNFESISGHYAGNKNLNRQKFGLDGLIAEIEKGYENRIDESKKIYKRMYLKGIYGNYEEMKFVLYLLLDNAYRYSGCFVYIRSGVYKGKKYLFISNDIGGDYDNGLGVGLAVAEQICRKNNFSFSWNEKRNFTAKIVF